MRPYHTLVLSCFIALGSCNERGTSASDLQDEAVADVTASMVAKLDRIVIPKVDIDDASIEEAVDFARICSFKYDPERNTEFRGVSFMERRSRANQEEESDGFPGIGIDGAARGKTMTYAAENVRLLDLVKEIARQGALDCYLTPVGIAFVPEGMPPFPNAKVEKGDVLKVLRRSEKNQDEQGAAGQPSAPR